MKALGKVGAHLLLPILVLTIPTAWLERGRSVCLIRAVTGRPCPGCGMTRAVSSVAHLRFRRALRHNQLVVAVLPLLVWEWARSLARAWREYADYGGTPRRCPPPRSSPMSHGAWTIYKP